MTQLMELPRSRQLLLTGFAPESALTRRQLMGGASTLLLLSACGQQETATRGSAPEPDVVTIEHKYGTTVIDGEPQRIAVVSATDHDPVLALGVTPVTVVDFRRSPYLPWNEDRVGTPRPVAISDPHNGFPFEVVAAQNPDVIVSLWSELSQSDYDKCLQIAPTVAPDGHYAPFGMPWQLRTEVVGHVLGRPAQAQRLVRSVEGQLADLAAAHPILAGKSVTIAADFGDGNIYLTPPSDSRYALLTALGMRTELPELAAVESLSFEQVGMLDAADVVVWLTIPGKATVQDNPVYLSQPVHQQGRDVFLDPTTALALTYSSVLSLPWVAPQLAPQLAAAADRDPATAIPTG